MITENRIDDNNKRFRCSFVFVVVLVLRILELQLTPLLVDSVVSSVVSIFLLSPEIIVEFCVQSLSYTYGKNVAQLPS